MEKKLRFGVFGTWRGLAFIKALGKIDEAEVVAICDQDESKIREAKNSARRTLRSAPILMS